MLYFPGHSSRSAGGAAEETRTSGTNELEGRSRRNKTAQRGAGQEVGPGMLRALHQGQR